MDFYTFVIIATGVGFTLLAFLLLAPVYLFLRRERRAAAQWDEEIRAYQAAEGTEKAAAPPSTAPDDAADRTA